MAKRRPSLKFTDNANLDIERCALFLCLKAGGQPNRRAAQIRREARRIANDPRLHPVGWVHPISRLEFRRKNVGQFVIVYVYFEPTASTPHGLVSIRAVRHGAQRDIRWGVEEPRPSQLPGVSYPVIPSLPSTVSASGQTEKGIRCGRD